MTTIGADCHITLTHAILNDGLPYGFILSPESASEGEAVVIQREITSDGVLTVRVFFEVLLADALVNPDGSLHEQHRAEMYAALTGYLEQTGGLTLGFAGGTIANIGALGHSATERHFADCAKISCQFNNAGEYFGVLDSTGFENSVWDGSLTWASSYWR